MCLGVRVLSLEVGDDLGILPVVVAQPEEVVCAFDGRIHRIGASILSGNFPEQYHVGLPFRRSMGSMTHTQLDAM